MLDPEVPVLTIADLGILRDVEVRRRRAAVVVTITPTYSGCPAMDAIRDDVETPAAAPASPTSTSRPCCRPAWTTDWMSDEGRRKLPAYGIAPPRRRAGAGGPVGADAVGALPAVRRLDTRELEPVRLDGLQVAVGVPRLPRAVRPLQGDLMT